MQRLPNHAGSKGEDTLYEAVGRYLSYWEKAETLLGLAYCCFMNTNPKLTLSSYGSLTGFEVRRKMIAAASDIYFESDESTKLQFSKLLSDINKESSHRHKIAHGQVHFIKKVKGRKGGYFLCAPFYNTRSRPFGEWSKYFYNDVEINDRRKNCDALSTQLQDLWLEGPLQLQMQHLELQLPKKFRPK
jgi:hypothetical protein